MADGCIAGVGVDSAGFRSVRVVVELVLELELHQHIDRNSRSSQSLLHRCNLG